MKLRTHNASPLLWSWRRSRPRLIPLVASAISVRSASNLSQRPDSNYVSFPGALKSAFTSKLSFAHPSEHPALPTYRVLDQNGKVVDQSFEADLKDEEVVKLYRDMLTISIMDVIMFDAQRQGRISFYMVSSGEEAVTVGSSSALARDDVVFCQYREQGVFQERGFTLRDFMSQLFANRNDPGKGRNMPVHYGSRELNIVRAILVISQETFGIDSRAAFYFFSSRHTNTTCIRRCICSEDTANAEPVCPTEDCCSLLRRRRSE